MSKYRPRLLIESLIQLSDETGATSLILDCCPLCGSDNPRPRRLKTASIYIDPSGVVVGHPLCLKHSRPRYASDGRLEVAIKVECKRGVRRVAELPEGVEYVVVKR